MKKLIVTALLTACIAIGSFADERVVIDGLPYSLRTATYEAEPGTFQCTLASPVESGYPTGNEYSGKVTVPAFVNYDGKKYAVTQIGTRAFYGQTALTQVELPSTLATIGMQAFQESGITSLTVPVNVKSIDNNAFRRCNDMKTLTLMPLTPPTASGTAFPTPVPTNCKLYVPKGCLNAYKTADVWKTFATIEEDPNSAVLPTSVSITGVPDVLLTGDTVRLKANILPADATDKTVEWKSLTPEIVSVDAATGLVTALSKGNALVEVICNGDRRISINASFMCGDSQATINGLKYRFVYDRHLPSDRAKAYLLRDNYAGNVVIPTLVQNGVTFTVRGIDANAFALNANVESVTLPASIDTVGYNAFRNCSGLKRVNISDISAWANISFRDNLATPLSNADAVLYLNGNPVSEVSIAGTIRTIKPFTFQGIRTLTKVTIGEGVRTLSDNVFKDCSALAVVSLPQSVDSIGLNVFSGCSALTAITLPGKIGTIRGGTFSGSGLRSIVIPDAVKIIDNQAFYNCKSLQEVEIGTGIRTLYLMVFDGCDAIRKVTVRATTPPEFFQTSVPGMTLNYFPPEVFTTAELLVPSESVDAYKAAFTWSRFTNIRAIGTETPGVKATIDGIAYELFADKLTAAVGDNTGCTGEIIIPATVKYEGKEYKVTEIGARAFAGSSVDLVKMAPSISHIGEEAFANCQRLVGVGLPDSLLSIGVKAFYGSEKIRYIRSYNYGTGADHVLPTFATYEGDPTNYGEAFSTGIWPDCMLCIPANMFMNYKGCDGWKNFRSWAYWHDNDVEPTEVSLEGRTIGRVGEKLRLKPAFAPANAMLVHWMLYYSDHEVIKITAATDADQKQYYEVELLKEGKATVSLYGNLTKGVAEITVDNSYNGIGGIDADGNAPARYFNLHGVEVTNPVKGIYVKVAGGKTTKVIL